MKTEIVISLIIGIASILSSWIISYKSSNDAKRLLKTIVALGNVSLVEFEEKRKKELDELNKRISHLEEWDLNLVNPFNSSKTNEKILNARKEHEQLLRKREEITHTLEIIYNYKEAIGSSKK